MQTQLAPEYAPELDIDGGAILAPGFTPPIQGVLDADDLVAFDVQLCQNLVVSLDTSE